MKTTSTINVPTINLSNNVHSTTYPFLPNDAIIFLTNNVKTSSRKKSVKSSTSSYNPYKMAQRYLKEEDCSFRKLEKEEMGINSPVRGGGFKAKKILNDLGVTADMKGILAHSDIDALTTIASTSNAETLRKVKSFLL